MSSMTSLTAAARRLGALVVVAVLAGSLLTAAPASAARVTPGNFTGFGFDQCLTPTQSAMDAWLLHSPYWAVGIYTSGDSRACRDQPNLTPTWVERQMAAGWRLLPITLGPQASCNARYPRYGDDERINPRSTTRYRAARLQGRAEAAKAVAAAQRLGIGAGSSLWYDLEGDFDPDRTHCRESALWFLSAWTNTLHRLGYVSGVYSSAGTGMRMIDDARVLRPGVFTLPDRIWIARWDEVPNTSTEYIREDGWRPGNRLKQYRGGHDETHGGVTINVDSNFLDLGAGSQPPPRKVHCGGVRIGYARYPTLTRTSTARVDAAQCLLRRAGHYSGPIDGVMTRPTRQAVRSFRAAVGLPAGNSVDAGVWTALHARGRAKVIKYGARSEMVRRLQRALNSASSQERLTTSGVFEASTTAAVKRYQGRVGLPRTGVVTPQAWALLKSGRT